LSRRTFTREFKLAAVRRLETGVSLADESRGLEVNRNLLHRRRREFRQAPGNAFPGNGQRRWSEGKIAELERKIGRQAVEIDFSKGVCSASKNSGAAGIEWKSAVDGKVGEEVNTGGDFRSSG
jgi:transposase-like protein